jgi:hypothetical protein
MAVFVMAVFVMAISISDLLFWDVLSRFGLAGLGIRNAVMLSDVDAAVTSQAGVLDFGFAVCQKQGCRAGRPASFASRRKPGNGRDRCRQAGAQGFPPFSGRDAAFSGVCHQPVCPTSHLAAGRFRGYSLQPTLPSSSG